MSSAPSAPAPATPAPVLRFSRHAEERIRARGLQITPAELERLRAAVEEASARGAKDSLVLAKGIAFVVNVPSRTVVTTMSAEPTGGHVFTNIDSAIVL